MAILILRSSAVALPAWLPSVGSWYEIPNTNPSSVEPASLPPGNGPRFKIDGWVSAAVDTRTSTVYLAAGGGHNDYAGNEVNRLALNVAAPAWEEIEPPSGTVSENVTHYGDGKPTSRHSYRGVTVDETGNRIMLWGGSWYGGAPQAMDVVDSFNLSTNNYNAAATHPDIPSGVHKEIRAIVRNPANDNVYMFGDYNAQRFNQSSNNWSTLISGQTGLYNEQRSAGAYDTSRDRIFLLGGNLVATYDVGGNSMSTQTLSGTDISATQEQAMVYVPSLDVYLVRHAASGGTVYQVNASTFAVSSLSTTGGGSIPATTNGPYNKFLYVPALRGCIYVPTYTGNCWFLRVH